MAKRYYAKPSFSEKKEDKKISNKFLLWGSAFLVLGLIFIGLFHFLVYADFFKIRRVEVTGSRLVANDEILRIVTPQAIPSYPWRLFWGPNRMLFWQFSNTKKITSSMLPLFEEAVIELDWKNRVLKIRVKERKFFGILCNASVKDQEGNKCFAFDKEGIVFGAAPLAEGSIFLKIQNENSQHVLLGSSILPRREWILKILETISVIEEAGKNARLVTIKDYALEEWEVSLLEGPRLIFSFRNVPNNMSGLIQNIERRFDLEKLEYIDFRVENRIFYK